MTVDLDPVHALVCYNRCREIEVAPMAVLPIVKIGDPILETRAQEVPRITKKITKLVEDMIETMYEANGAGLAAPQVGVNKRIIVVDLGEGPVCLINPVVQSAQGKRSMWRAA